MTVEELTADHYKEWDQFILKHTHGTLFHQTGWKQLVEKVYGLKPFYLMAIEQEAVTGVLPLFYVNHWYFGKKLISIPFAVYGGLCTISEEAGDLLVKRAVRLADTLNVKYMELRHIEPFNQRHLNTEQTYFTFLIRLHEDPSHVWKNVRRDSRRCIRRGLEQDFEIEMESQDVRDFYTIYARGQRDLGTPVLGFRWIENLFHTFPELHTISRIRYKGQTIASLIVREYKDTLSPTIGYALKEYKGLHPLYALYWKLIEKACKKGYQWFDFGRSIKESGTFPFKRWFGAEPVPLNYQYYLRNGCKIPDTSQKSPSRKKLSVVWKKLPVSFTNRLGPQIRKHFP